MSTQGDDEEDTGPSIDSADQEERIAARRLRIQRRTEAAKRFKKFCLKFTYYLKHKSESDVLGNY